MASDRQATKRTELFRCAAHGLIETTTACFNGDDGTTEHICPVLIGDGDSCGLMLDDPIPVVSVSDLQRVFAECRAAQPLPKLGAESYEVGYDDGYGRALNDLRSALGLDGGGD